MYHKSLSFIVASLILLSLLTSPGLAESPKSPEIDLAYSLLSAVAEKSSYMKGYSLATDNQVMQYDCISFANSWPEPILPDMEKCFQSIHPICGLYCLWQPIAGESLAYVFVAGRSNDTVSLWGAQYRNGEWISRVISESFFRPEESFAIVLHPQLRMDGSISSYSPSVFYPGEWFVFQPSFFEFDFQYYEREKKPIDEFNEDVHMLIESNDTPAVGRQFIVSTVNNGIRTLCYSGSIADEFNIEQISAITFPTTLEEVMSLCEPNG